MPPDLMAGVTERLREFVAPFVRALFQGKQRVRVTNLIGGLLSDVERKNAESIAYRYDEERKDMEYFLGESSWDHRPLLVELATQVGRELGRPDGEIVFAPRNRGHDRPIRRVRVICLAIRGTCP